MARNIGPEMLEILEQNRQRMGESAYHAKRLEVEELIRKGKAVELETSDHIKALLWIVFGVLGAVVLGLNLPGPFGWVFGIAALVVGILSAARVGRNAR